MAKSIPSEEQFNLDRRIVEESQPFFTIISANNQTFGTGVTLKSISGGVIIYPGYVFIPKNIQVFATRQLGLYAIVGGSPPSGYFSYQFTGIGSISISNDIYPAIEECSSINISVERFDVSDGDTPFSIRANVSGYLISKGYDTKSDYNILCLGDSIMQNSAVIGINDDSLYQGIVRNYFCTNANTSKKGKIARLINKAKGGATSTNLINQIKSNLLSISEHIDLIMCAIGTNDVILANATTQPQIDALITTYISNITFLVNNHIKKYGSLTKLLIIAPPPLYNTTQESTMLQVRNALKSYLASIGAGIWNGGSTAITTPTNNIWFASLGATNAQSGLWTANSYTYYIEQTGNAVHPNQTAHTLIGNHLTNMFTVNNITF